MHVSKAALHDSQFKMIPIYFNLVPENLQYNDNLSNYDTIWALVFIGGAVSMNGVYVAEFHETVNFRS